MKYLALIALVGCAREEAPTSTSAVAPPTTSAPVAPAAPAVPFLAWSADTVRFLTATTTITEVRKVVLPGSDDQALAIDEVKWAGSEVYVRYDTTKLGRITPTGFEPLPDVPASKWRKKAPADMERVPEEWTLVATSKGAWLGHCEWGTAGFDDQNECNHWEHVRVYPGKLEKVAYEPDAPAAHPEVKPTKITTSTFEIESATILRCARDGKTIEIPAADATNRAYGVGGEPEWLSAEPAIFRITELHEGDPTTEQTSVFENCAKTAYRDAVRGPQGMIALLGTFDQPSSIRRDGREIGTVPEANVVFAP